MSVQSPNRAGLYIGLSGCAAAIVCSPPLFEPVLALEPLHPEDIVPLWIFSVVLLGVSAFTAFSRFRVRHTIAATVFPILLLICVEMTARMHIKNMADNERESVMMLARSTYRDLASYQPHPFLQFTGRPNARFQDNAWGEFGRFNKHGFIGPDLEELKPPGTIRIVCLGGSTTGDGYPAILEGLLKEHAAPGYNVQVMNFGLGWYTSAHSVINFALNALDYSPDYVVILHSINEGRGRGLSSPVRGDYAHFLKSFEYPEIRDAYLVRASVIYRYLKERVAGSPYWAFLDNAVIREDNALIESPFNDIADLRPYERNIRTIVDLALLRGITPVLMTQPHSDDPATWADRYEKHFVQSNELVRRLVDEYGQAHRDQFLFVDLDRIFSGRNEIFDDMVHMTRGGVTMKAEAIKEIILPDLNKSWGRDRQ